MKWSLFGRAAMALMSAVALGLGMTACGGGTVAYLWAVGTTSTSNAQVVGYRVDDYTGNLTATPNAPFSANGNVPVDVLVKPGGRFVYVIDQGTGYTNKASGSSDNVAVYAVGGTGSLTYEQGYETQGYGHVWAQFDSTGSYLFVLDKYAASGSGNGAITTFAVDANTGRLNLVNQNASTQPGQAAPTYLEVGANPLRMYAAGNCLFTVNSGNQTISTYSIASGQLGTVTTGTFPTGATNITSINGPTGGQYVFLTDNLNDATKAGVIYSYTVGTGCALTPFTGGQTANDPTVANPVNTFMSASGTYLYVMNSGNPNTTTNTRSSTLTAFVINAGQLQEIRNSPFSTGSGPVCMVEDPTAKFMYVADYYDGTITGYDFDNTQGQLSNLQRGSKFQTTASSLTCMALTGNV